MEEEKETTQDYVKVKWPEPAVELMMNIWEPAMKQMNQAIMEWTIKLNQAAGEMGAVYVSQDWMTLAEPSADTLIASLKRIRDYRAGQETAGT